MRGLVEERDPAPAPTQSVLEDTLLPVLRRGGLPESVRQYELGDVRRRPAYVVDAVARELVLAWPA